MPKIPLKSAIICCLTIAMAMTGGVAVAQTEPLDLSVYDEQLVGQPTRIAILGTAHLSSMTEIIEPADLEPLLDRLENFAPDVIAIETISGIQCQQLLANPDIYPGVAQRYCRDPADHAASLGLTVAQANAATNAILAEWPDEPTHADRRKLAAHFLAAGEPWSALVQWLSLFSAERRTGDGIDAAMVERLESLAASPNENGQIGAALAVRLGHQRLYASDDHSADSITAPLGDALGERMGAIWGQNIGDARGKYEGARQQLADDGDILAFYRRANSHEMADAAIRADFAAALGDTQPGKLGQQYTSWWQVRNLRMVATVVEAAANLPGAKVLRPRIAPISKTIST